VSAKACPEVEVVTGGDEML